MFYTYCLSPGPLIGLIVELSSPIDVLLMAYIRVTVVDRSLQNFKIHQ